MLQSAPDWVSFESEKGDGIDLLGLRAPVQIIGNELFDGVNTVTPKLRYMSIIAWIIWRYAQARLPEAWGPFVQFAAAQEAAFVMANLLHDRSTLRLVGASVARDRVDSGRRRLSLDQLIQDLAFNIYLVSSRQLKLTHLMESGFNGLTKDRGLPLARAFDHTISKYSYGARLAKRPVFDRVPYSELEELSKGVSLDRIPSDEKSILIDALMPVNPESDEWPRLQTYALVLWLSKEKGEFVEEADVFEAAVEVPENLPSQLRGILDGWLSYIVRDAIAVTHEAMFAAVMHQVDIQSIERGAPARGADVVAALLSAIEDHDAVLRQFGLLKKTESVAHITFAELQHRIKRKCGNREMISDGLRRWHQGLSETELYQAALKSGAAAAAILPIIWCLTEHRVSATDASGSAGADLLSQGGFYRIGLADVIFPKIDEFVRDGRTVIDVIGELIRRTVQQHLRIAWSRLAPRQSKDVSVLIADADAWSRNNPFQAGRTDSRLSYAIGWLRQLALLDADGLTASGERILERCIKTLAGRHHA